MNGFNKIKNFLRFDEPKTRIIVDINKLSVVDANELCLLIQRTIASISEPRTCGKFELIRSYLDELFRYRNAGNYQFLFKYIIDTNQFQFASMLNEETEMVLCFSPIQNIYTEVEDYHDAIYQFFDEIQKFGHRRIGLWW